VSTSQTATTRMNLGSALRGFLRFYGQEFDYANTSIQFTSSSVRYAVKTWSYSSPSYLLSITDPADSSVNMGSKAYGMKHVQETFRDAYATLVALVDGTATRDQRTKARVEGILGCWLGGEYSQFDRERKEIRRRWRSQQS
jgi:non-canonical poly(A) RNA polymerase PAPD5/7